MKRWKIEPEAERDGVTPRREFAAQSIESVNCRGESSAQSDITYIFVAIREDPRKYGIIKFTRSARRRFNAPYVAVRRNVVERKMRAFRLTGQTNYVKTRREKRCAQTLFLVIRVAMPPSGATASLCLVGTPGAGRIAENDFRDNFTRLVTGFSLPATPFRGPAATSVLNGTA